MRTRLPLTFVALFVSALPLAHAQAPAQPPRAVDRGGGIAGTAFGGTGAAGAQATVPHGNRARAPLVVLGTGHIGAGTGGLGHGMGNASGGVKNTALGAGSGGLGDLQSWGSLTGGVHGHGRGLDAGSGGLQDSAESGTGINTGGINGSAIGAGTGGLRDLDSLGAATGGTKENGNAPRFRVVR